MPFCVIRSLPPFTPAVVIRFLSALRSIGADFEINGVALRDFAGFRSLKTIGSYVYILSNPQVCLLPFPYHFCLVFLPAPVVLAAAVLLSRTSRPILMLLTRPVRDRMPASRSCKRLKGCAI